MLGFIIFCNCFAEAVVEGNRSRGASAGWCGNLYAELSFPRLPQAKAQKGKKEPDEWNEPVNLQDYAAPEPAATRKKAPVCFSLVPACGQKVVVRELKLDDKKRAGGMLGFIFF